MPLTISALQTDEVKTVAIEWEEKPVSIQYRDLMTPLRFQLQMRWYTINQSLQKGGSVNLKDAAGLTEMLTVVLASMLVEWEVIDADGSMYPTTPDALAVLPTDFLFAVFGAISAEQADPNASKTGKRSRGG